MVEVIPGVSGERERRCSHVSHYTYAVFELARSGVFSGSLIKLLSFLLSLLQVARRFRQHGSRMYALLEVWYSTHGRDIRFRRVRSIFLPVFEA